MTDALQGPGKAAVKARKDPTRDSVPRPSAAVTVELTGRGREIGSIGASEPECRRVALLGRGGIAGGDAGDGGRLDLSTGARGRLVYGYPVFGVSEADLAPTRAGLLHGADVVPGGEHDVQGTTKPPAEGVAGGGR